MNPTEGQGDAIITAHPADEVEYPPPYEQTQIRPLLTRELLAQRGAMAAMPVQSFQTPFQQQPRNSTPELLSSRSQKLGNKIKQLQADLKTAEKENTMLSEELRWAKRRSNHLESTIADLRNNLDRAHQENGSHIRTQKSLNNELNNARAVNSSQNQRINILEEEIRRYKADIQSVRSDNESIRTEFFRNNSDLSPRRGEEHYMQTFEKLSSDLERWIVKASKAGGVMPLPVDAEKSALEMLEKLGARGKASAEFLRANQTIRVWYRDVRARIPLIFEPLAVGLPTELREVFLWIDDDLMSQEKQFQKMLRIRQGLCREVKRYATYHNKGTEVFLAERMTQLLSLILPAASIDDIAKAAEGFVNKSIKFKYEMTDESAVYSCHWVNSGENFDENQAEQGGDERGPVYMCTFPGLLRTVGKESDWITICAVKASVVLQSTFIG